MSKSIGILKQIEEMDRLKVDRNRSFDTVDSNFDYENEIRYQKCPNCKKVTEQRVDERTVTFEVGEKCNNSFTERTFKKVLGWWCNECDDELQIIKQPPD